MEENQVPLRVTALIVTRNCADPLRRCLAALEKSTERASMEVLVIDNGSEDETAIVADEFPAVTMLKLPKNFGKTKGLNIGIRTAKGEFLLLMDAHVEVEPDTVARLLARIAADDSVGAVCSYVGFAHPLPSPEHLKSAWHSGVLAGAQPVDPASDEVAVDYPDRRGSPMLVRRGFVKGMNYFDERLGEQWTDLELCWQLRSAGKRILVLPKVQVSSERGQEFSGVLESADSAAGAAAYISKHYGMGAGLGFRLSAILHALGAFDMKLLSALVSGRRIDGTQG